MGFMSEFKRARDGGPAGDVYEVAGKALVCPHCGGSRFNKGEAQLNTAGLTFLDLDFLNRTVDVYECVNCGHIDWFA